MSIEKPELPAEKQEELKKYIYRDNTAASQILFECTAKNILEADKMYQEKTGQKPEQQGHVGCSVEKIDPAL
jgi:hypothetical protein